MTQDEATKIKRVATELRSLGVEDRDSVFAVAARITVSDDGRLVGLDQNGRPGVGTAPGYYMSVHDVLNDLGTASSPSSKSRTNIPPNPFLPGQNFNMTAGMLLFRTHPDLAADYANEAGFMYRNTVK